MAQTDSTHISLTKASHMATQNFKAAVVCNCTTGPEEQGIFSVPHCLLWYTSVWIFPATK